MQKGCNICVLKGKKNEFLWILEHKTVCTAGTRSKSEDLINKNIKETKSNKKLLQILWCKPS